MMTRARSARHPISQTAARQLQRVVSQPPRTGAEDESMPCFARPSVCDVHELLGTDATSGGRAGPAKVDGLRPCGMGVDLLSCRKLLTIATHNAARMQDRRAWLTFRSRNFDAVSPWPDGGLFWFHEAVSDAALRRNFGFSTPGASVRRPSSEVAGLQVWLTPRSAASGDSMMTRARSARHPMSQPAARQLQRVVLRASVQHDGVAVACIYASQLLETPRCTAPRRFPLPAPLASALCCRHVGQRLPEARPTVGPFRAPADRPIKGTVGEGSSLSHA
jgi:hypothetical protein